mgnify:CR=1 FL=1
MNRQAFDFGVERYSLSAFLARSGFDCFALDLRGHGGPRRGPTSRRTLDPHLAEDLPAALAFVGHLFGIGTAHSGTALIGGLLYTPDFPGSFLLAGVGVWVAPPSGGWGRPLSWEAGIVR